MDASEEAAKSALEVRARLSGVLRIEPASQKPDMPPTPLGATRGTEPF